MRRAIYAILNALTNFKQTEFDKQVSKTDDVADRDGIAVRYQW